MRTFTKKRGFFAVAATLLIVTVMLVTTWCSNDIGDESTDNFTLPPGKGAVRLSFNEKIARTILPDDYTDISQFDKFDFEFTPTSSTGTAKIVKDLNHSNTDGAIGTILAPIILDPGTYRLTVYAYIGSDPAAKSDPGETGDITITAAKTTSATIKLRPYDQATGNGTFNYKITSTIAVGDITSATMNLTPILHGASDTVDLISQSKWNAAATDLPVVAGDYYLDFVVLVKTGETVTFRHIVHIYHNLTSTYDFTINPDYFNAVFQLISSNISYEHPEDVTMSFATDGTPSSLSEGGTVIVRKGDSVEITASAISPGGTTITGYEWYSQDGLDIGDGSNVFTVDTTNSGEFSNKKTYLLTIVAVTKDAALVEKKYYNYIYIKVIESSPLLSLNGTSNNLLNGATVNVTLGNTTTITVINNDFVSYDWYIGSSSLGIDSHTYIVDTSTAQFSTIGPYELKVEGIENGKSYFTTITINVVAP